MIVRVVSLSLLFPSPPADSPETSRCHPIAEVISIPMFKEIVVLRETFGPHVDGAPITYAAFALTRERIRRLLALIKDYERRLDRHEAMLPGNLRPITSEEVDLFPSFIPVRATMRKPYYSLFKRARLQRVGCQFYDPKMINHIEPVQYADPCIMFGRGLFSVGARQHPIPRQMQSASFYRDELYLALTLATPLAELPKLLHEMAIEAPHAFRRLMFADEPVYWYSPTGIQEVRIPDDVYVCLDQHIIMRFLKDQSPAVRQNVLSRLSQLLDADSRSPTMEFRPSRSRCWQSSLGLYQKYVY